MQIEILLAIRDADAETLCRWGNTLNVWRWPRDLPGKPAGFDNRIVYAFETGLPDKHSIISPLIRTLKGIVGEEAFTRYRWVKVLKKKPEDFDKWWSENNGSCN